MQAPASLAIVATDELGAKQAVFRFGRMLALAMSAWLAACASDASQQSLPPEKADGRYALTSFSLNTKKDGTSRSDTLPVYYRVFEKDRKLAICGYYLVQSSSCERDLNRQLLDNSEVLVNDKPVGSGRFFNAVPGTLNFDLASRSFSH